jgi:CYTH domain-containing protein/thymidylate kinase
MNSIPKFVLTGGPCSGKSSAKAVLQQRLPQLGIRPIFIPEVATILFTSGVDIASILKDASSVSELQFLILSQQLKMEEVFTNLAKMQQENTEDKVVLICDRAALDGLAYVSEEAFRSITKAVNLSKEQLIARYEAVFHLVTTADGAEQFYSLDNPARYETKEEAVRVDKRLQQAWSGHPHFRIIANKNPQGKSLSFDQKLDRLVTDVCHTVGIPAPVEIERKFLLPNAPIIPMPTTSVRIHQTYLVGKDKSRRVRRWYYADSDPADALYFYTEKRGTGLERVEYEERIDVSRYNELLRERILGSADIVKMRSCFSWNNQYFELDMFESPLPLVILEVELTEASDTIKLPPFVRKAVDVTDNSRYSNANIAMGSLIR